ncbi:MAG: amidohydrolase family protein [Myxococcota bacterium]|nr:amidohydrolase family protein [Myxococcota bacterium]
MHDVVIRGGTLVDGTGTAPRRGDLALAGDRIVAVGSVEGSGRREIDADGLLVTPGFVDVHTHYDGQATWDSELAPSCWHGVTTAVMGNCGVGFAPASPDKHDWLIGLMEGVEDIPGTALAEGLKWDWESFPEYLDALERVPHTLDIAAQFPHGALRAYVMDERGADHREVPTEAEIAEMARLVREGIEAGALGFTTSRTRNHRTVDGEPTPSLTATAPELWGIARALGEAGKGVFEIVCDFTDLEEEFALIREMSVQSGRLVSISLVQTDADPDQWRRLLELMEAANREGATLRGQVAPRPIGVIMGLESTLHPFVMHPAYREVADLPLEARVAALRDPARRKRLCQEDRGEGPSGVLGPWERLFAFRDPPDYEPDPSTSIASRARDAGVSPTELALDTLLGEDGRAQVYWPVLNYNAGNSDVSREMLLHPLTVPGLGDGGAHVSFISDASFPTYLLTHWARDRRRGEGLPLEWLVKRQTRDTAELVGLRDRGLLVPGLRADVNLIDFDALRVLRPDMQYDLPAGGKRLVQRAEGYRMTFVAGEAIQEDGETTGALPGKLVRGAQEAS